MNRLMALLQGKLEVKRAENKVKRVEAALAVAALNFKTQKDDNECKLTEILNKFNNPDIKVESIIQEISDTMTLIDEANEGIAKVNKIKKFLFEEIKAEN